MFVYRVCKFTARMYSLSVHKFTGGTHRKKFIVGSIQYNPNTIPHMHYFSYRYGISPGLY